ncbi:gigaxonin [Hypomesus transpacificus]|uniref:gigaxonin n=1 Tax=Hypomesus transpacificus TaxID=137520 RepID=UPI001F07611E|nr:gigaxonin [Hypomesus transpacificus]XP_046890222.1 gigaxonin [Hypomesus transpacificus]
MPDPDAVAGGSVVSDPQHSQKLLRALRSLCKEQCFQDSVLVLDGERIPVQRNILAAASPYIRTKLNYNPPKEDGSMYTIELQGISVPIMEQILEYIFTGEISLSEDTIQDMVQAADLLLLTDLKSLCCQFLESCICANNCIGIRLFSLHYCLHHVYHSATDFLQTHFRDVAVSDEYRELPPDRVCELLAMEKLNVGSEKHVLEAAVRWLGHDLEGRRVHMKEVMSAVWVQGLDVPYLREQALGEPLMREVVREYCQAPLGGAPLQGEEMLAAFKPRGYSECIVTVGGEDRKTRKPSAATRCMCPLYDLNKQLWIDLEPMSVARTGHGAVTADGYLFVIGGMDENKTPLNSGERYDPESNTWTAIPPMKQARQNFGIVEMDGLVFVLGGENEETELLTMEVFDPHFKTWTTQTSMTMVRKIGCYASMNKKIYAMGGGSYGKLYDSVECYDPKTQQWTGLSPLKERRFGSVACGVGQELYVFGGVRSKDSENPENSQMTTCKSEFYHDEMRRWLYLDDQNLCVQTSSSFVYGAVAIGASIYVVGDLDTGTSYDYVREFRRSSGTWHRTKPMLTSDLCKTACSALRIANCRLFRLQLKQGLFRIRMPNV